MVLTLKLEVKIYKKTIFYLKFSLEDWQTILSSSSRVLKSHAMAVRHTQFNQFTHSHVTPYISHAEKAMPSNPGSYSLRVSPSRWHHARR